MSDQLPFRLEVEASERPSAPTRWLWLAALLLPPAAAQELPPAADGASPVPPLSAPAVADDSSDDDDVAVDAQRDEHRELPMRRLLHGAGGGVLRGMSRWAVDHWDLERDGHWEQLPPGSVGEVRREADVLAEAGARQAAVRRGTAAQRVEVAAWMLDQGLLKEGLHLLDEILADEPDQPEALALLRRDELPIAMPRLDVPAADQPVARTQFLEWAGATPPAVREIAVHRLAQLDAPPAAEPGQPDALRQELQQQLSGRAAGGRSFAALALRRLVPAGEASQPEVEELLRRAVLDVSPDVRHQASLALRANGDPAVILPVVAALASRSSAVRINAATSLGQMGYAAAVPTLVDRLMTLSPGSGDYRPRANVFVGRQIAYVAGYNVEVANQAAIAEPEIGVLQEGATLDVTVSGTSTSSYAVEARALSTALQQLTGAHPGDSKAAWRKWWEQNSSKY